jgi:DNA replication ATP-dependent helicase Dna2
VFVDTDSVPAKDSRVGDLVQNEVEANLVYQFVETIVRCGVAQEQIGIISLYRQQVKLLSHLLQERKEIEIFTADRSQGRDKECIIISMVRSNDEGQVRHSFLWSRVVGRNTERGRQIGDLMKDWRRMNVAFTRARSKLIIVGSRKTLRATPLLKEFFNVMESQDWILSLPAKADTMHVVPGTSVSSQNKRPVDGRERFSVSDKENVVGVAAERPLKKAKGASKVSTAGEGILRGRPILKDLINNER